MKIINQADMLIGMIRRAALGMALAATLSGCHVYKGKIEGCEVTVDQKALMDYEGIDIGAYYRTRVKCQGEEVYFFHYERYGDLERMCRSGLGMGKDCVRAAELDQKYVKMFKRMMSEIKRREGKENAEAMPWDM